MLNDRASTNINMVFNDHISVAHHAWRKSNIVAYYTIVLHIAVKIGVEMLTDADIAGECDKWTECGPFIQFDIVHLHHALGTNFKKI